MNLGNGKYPAQVQSLYLLRLKKARLLSDKGGALFNSGKEYMTIELINQYQSQGKLS